MTANKFVTTDYYFSFCKYFSFVTLDIVLNCECSSLQLYANLFLYRHTQLEKSCRTFSYAYVNQLHYTLRQ